MKIIGFAQLRNEINRGNLENWFRSMWQVCDMIYIYDQNSDDGSKEYYKTQPNTVVIESPVNDYEKELQCKQTLLDKIRTEQPDTDWIFWMDGDTLLDGRLNKSNVEGIFGEHDYIDLGHLNLWRSDTYYRIDNQFHSLNGGVTAFWKNVPYMYFNTNSGLHRGNCPSGFKNGGRAPNDYTLIHRGFATDDQITTRLEDWKWQADSWPRGRAGVEKHWNRFFNEDGLNVQRLDDIVLPDWFKLTDDVDPRTKPKLIELYEKPSF